LEEALSHEIRVKGLCEDMLEDASDKKLTQERETRTNVKAQLDFAK